MKTLIMKTMMASITLIPFIKNPVSMGGLLLLQTTLMTLLINKMMMSAWYAMITFLMMVGGLLILFTYMSSIASNEKFKLKINLTLITLFMIVITEEMMNENQTEEKEKLINMTEEYTSMTKIYNKKSMIMTMLLVMYLLLTMIVSTKIVKHNEGPLRSKTYE
uniref:NADH dehydrogenase subunit 6 n=1 Tax=Bothrogonia yunana TaxID=1079933 RepID=A0A7D5YEB1_9HEMI|nr:NADH dehydrogenase subunit 6 [Bothrogonia yunana]QLI54109.1 NADH dehydrogenase subunit 6 [Bothrogonia yunana]